MDLNSRSLLVVARITKMSARDGPSGATNRSDLFVSAKTGRQNNEIAGSNEIDDFPGLDEEDDQNPLQIEHVMGYAGDFRQTVLALNGNENVYIKSLGCLVLVENLMDPHDQKLLRGHDMEVRVVDISLPTQGFAHLEITL